MRRYLRPSISTLMVLAFSAFVTALTGAPSWETLEGARLKSGAYADGDSFHVVHEGKEYVFRLFYVDTPETNDRYPERVKGQAKYFSTSAKAVIELGDEAAEFTQKFLKGGFTVYTDWSDGWGHGTRYRAMIYKNGKDLASELVSRGLARASGFIPDSPWPGYHGSVWDYRNYLNKLKDEAERDGVGGWANSRSSKEKRGEPTTIEVQKSSDGRIDLNSASESELDSLPRIGPVLAERIVNARPFFSIEELDQVVGISYSTIESLRPYALVVPPPIQPNTALYFKEHARAYMNLEVRVTINTLHPLRDWAPKGYSVADANTSYEGTPGGRIRLFAPKEKMDFALQRFESSEEPLDVRAWLRDYEGETILVVY